MSTRIYRKKHELLRSAGPAVLAMLVAPGLAHAAPTYTGASVTVTGSTISIDAEQTNGVYQATPVPVVLGANTLGSILSSITGGDPSVYALQGSTVTVGASATTGNTASATGYANTATLAIALTGANTLSGSGSAELLASADSTNANPVGATVTAIDDLGVHVSQQATDVAATVSDASIIGITVDYGSNDSTMTVAGNEQTSLAVLNSATSSFIGTSVNASTASVGLASSQSSYRSSVSSTVSGTASVGVSNAPTDGSALLDSTLSLVDNSQNATAVGNSGSNSQNLTGTNSIVFGDSTNEVGQQAQTNATSASTVAGFATVARQELVGGADSEDSVDVAASINNADNPSFLVGINGNVSSSTVSNDRNSATALANGNEFANTISLAGNSFQTSTYTETSVTVAGIAVRQSVNDFLTIRGEVSTDTGNNPAVNNQITGSVVGNSTVTASDNSVSAAASGNLVSNGIDASATNINTWDPYTWNPETNSATATQTSTTSNAAFAVASQQTVSSGTTVLADLVHFTSSPSDGLATDGGASVTTSVSADVTNSTVLSTDNTLSASATGNGMLSSGNTINLGGTNLSTTAAISSSQAMDGDVQAVIGSQGTAGTPATPGSSGTLNNFSFSGTTGGSAGDYTFSGTATGTSGDSAALQAAYPSLTFTYSSGLITLFASGGALPYVTPALLSYTSGSTPPTPATPGTPSTGGVIITIGDDITSSEVAVSGNLTSGSASGNRSVNALTATPTNSLARGDDTTSASAIFDGTASAASTADLAVSNVQYVGDTGSVTSLVGAQFGVGAIGDTSDILGSHVVASNNTLSSTATGNTTVNSATLGGASIATTAAVTSAQGVGNASITATTASFSGAGVVLGEFLSATGDITNSTVAADGNEISGSASANRANNSLFADASNALSGDFNGQGPASYNDDTGVTNATADMALANVQGAFGTLVNSSADGMFVVDAGGSGSDVLNSTVTASNNEQSAASTGNAAGNTMSLSGSTITANSALASRQLATGNIYASTGFGAAGAVVTVGQDITNSTVATNGNKVSGSVVGNVANNAVNVAAEGLLDNGSAVTSASASLDNDLLIATSDHDLANSQEVNGGQAYGLLNSNASAMFLVEASSNNSDVANSTVTSSHNALSSSVTGNSASNANTLSAATVSATTALANNQVVVGALLSALVTDVDQDVSSGASIVIGRDVSNSTIAVDGNSITGTATGNSAVNKVSAAGSQAIVAGDTTLGATTDPSTALPSVLAQADNALLNTQIVATTNLGTSIEGSFGITTLGAGAPGGDAATSDVSNSTLSVSGNAQLALTNANVAKNTVDLSGGSIATNAALQSYQGSYSGVTEDLSSMAVQAPAANTASTLSMNANSNIASSTVNDATNAMTVSAATALTATNGVGTNAVLSGSTVGDYVGTADYAVNNYQSVLQGLVSALAGTSIVNNDDEGPTNGITSSTVAINGNSTTAMATSNRSSNSLSLSANAETASGGVLNQQTNAATVFAQAQMYAGVGVTGYNAPSSPDVAPISTSGVTVNNNTTTARAGGNSANNALNVSALEISNAGSNPSVSLTAARTDNVATTFAILNEQGNSGSVSAVAGVTYGAGFYAAGTPAQTVDRSSVAVNGNSTLAVAYGNAATNTASFNALNGTGGTTLAVASNQANTGSITAQSNTYNAINVGGTGSGSLAPVYQSSLAVNNNALGASAYGNSVTTTVTFGGNNLNVAPVIQQLNN